MVHEISVINVREVPEQDEGEETERMATLAQDASYWNGLYIPFILGVCILTTSILTLIPRHNSIAYPEYWFEMAIIFVVFFSTNSTLSYVMEVFIYMDLESHASVKVALKHYCRTLLAFGLPYGGLCLLWTKGLQLNHPMPFLAYSALITWILTLPLVWFLIPPHLREKKEYQKKTGLYILYQVVWMMIVIQKIFLTITFETLPPEYQWVMSILVPSCRSLDSWILSKVVNKMSGKDNKLASILFSVALVIDFAVYVAVMLSTANDMTVYCILAAEFILHLFSCYQIIRLQKKIQEDNVANEEIEMERRQAIENVLLSETVEALVPLAYAASFATAFYGPNSKMLGNVRAQYWAYQEVEDVEPLYTAMMLMFSADMFCVVATGLILWILGRINMAKHFLVVMKKYWWLLVVKLSAMFLNMFAQNDINNGCDYSFQFGWITEEGRLRLIQNATDLSDDEKAILLN